MKKKPDKIYRVEGSAVPGPDYRCCTCERRGVRLWRQTNTMLGAVDLLCSICATEDQEKEIARYASFHKEHDCTIGDLVPARPTPAGDTFWGHTSGDVLWWYALPQYLDPESELAQVRVERDRWLAMEVKLYKQLDEVKRDLEHLRNRAQRP